MASPPSETLPCLAMVVLWVGLMVPLLSPLWPHKAKAILMLPHQCSEPLSEV